MACCKGLTLSFVSGAQGAGAKSPSAVPRSSHCRPSSHPARGTALLHHSTPTSPLNWQAPIANPCRVQMCSQSTGRGTIANSHRGRETLQYRTRPSSTDTPFTTLAHIHHPNILPCADCPGRRRKNITVMSSYALYSLPITQC